MAAILGILDRIGTALNPAFGGGLGSNPSESTAAGIRDLYGFFVPGGSYGTTVGGQAMTPDAMEPLIQGMQYALWISLAFLVGALIFGGAQLGYARSQGYEPNAGAQRILVGVVVAALMGTIGSIAGMLIA